MQIIINLARGSPAPLPTPHPTYVPSRQAALQGGGGERREREGGGRREEEEEEEG